MSQASKRSPATLKRHRLLLPCVVLLLELAVNCWSTLACFFFFFLLARFLLLQLAFFFHTLLAFAACFLLASCLLASCACIFSIVLACSCSLLSFCILLLQLAFSFDVVLALVACFQLSTVRRHLLRVISSLTPSPLPSAGVSGSDVRITYNL